MIETRVEEAGGGEVEQFRELIDSQNLIAPKEEESAKDEASSTLAEMEGQSS